MDAASSRGTDAEAEVWRERQYRYLAGVLAMDASAAADYHDLQARRDLAFVRLSFVRACVWCVCE